MSKIAANLKENEKALQFFEMAQATLPEPNEQLSGLIASLKAGEELDHLGGIFRPTAETSQGGGKDGSKRKGKSGSSKSSKGAKGSAAA